MAGLTDYEREAKEKRFQLPKPEAFDGAMDANPTYKRWYKQMNDYLHHYRGTWDDDEDLIRIIGAFLKGKARDWFDTRADSLLENRKRDTFAALISAMNDRYKVDFEKQANTQKLFREKYAGSVLQYIDRMESLN